MRPSASLVALVPALLGLTVAGCAGRSTTVDAPPCMVARENSEEVFCTQQYEPVCGCNEQTYGNACMARLAGVLRHRPGRCEDPPPEA